MKNISFESLWMYWDKMDDRQLYLLPTITFDHYERIDLNGSFTSIEFRLLYLRIGFQINYNFTWLTSFFDRNYNIIFNRKKCFMLIFEKNFFKYNDTLLIGVNRVRYLGKNWCIILKDEEKECD